VTKAERRALLLRLLGMSYCIYCGDPCRGVVCLAHQDLLGE
jgi:hypothetical protein